MNRGRPKKEKCNHDCFNCCYPDCKCKETVLTEFEKKCAAIANAPGIHAEEHHAKEFSFFDSGIRKNNFSDWISRLLK